MNITDYIILFKDIGLPATILFYVLFIGRQNQSDMTNQLSGIQGKIADLTGAIHEAIAYIKAKGGE